MGEEDNAQKAKAEYDTLQKMIDSERVRIFETNPLPKIIEQEIQTEFPNIWQRIFGGKRTTTSYKPTTPSKRKFTIEKVE